MSDIADIAVGLVQRSRIDVEIQAVLPQLRKSLVVRTDPRSPYRGGSDQTPFPAGAVRSPHNLLGAHFALAINCVGLVIERMGGNVSNHAHQLGGGPDTTPYAWRLPNGLYKVGYTFDIRRISANVFLLLEVGAGGKVHDCVGSEFADECRQARPVENITYVIYGGAAGVSGRLAIEPGDHKSSVGQILNQGCPDQAGASGNQNFFHGKKTPLSQPN